MKFFPTVFMTAVIFSTACEIMPRNTLSDCRAQCEDSKKSKACYDFCDCIHKDGQPLDSCLEKYNEAPEDSTKTLK